MENVVSARRLRKSMLNDYTFDGRSERHGAEKRKLKFKTKFLIQLLISSIILFATIFTVNNYGSKLNENKIINRMYQHYKFNFNSELILSNFEEMVRSVNKYVGNIVPSKIKSAVVNFYFESLKPVLLKVDVKSILKNNNKEVEIYIYNERNVVKNESKIIPKTVSKDNIITIENIEKVLPTVGIITSRFGEREKIFDELSTNHTGIDIANNIGTDIVSATTGNVVKVVHGDKYYGNYIEIDSHGFIFKYAHLNETLVNENDNVKIGQKIGTMGSTGMSTGPHLHFEIIVDSKKIDPESVMKFE